MKILFTQTNYPDFLNTFYKDLKGWKRMSYKEIKKAWSQEYFGCSDFYLKNLRPLGWTGDEVILNDWNLQSTWAKEHKINVDRTGSLPIWNYVPARIKNLLGLNGWMKKIFFEQLKYKKPDVVYFHDLTIFNQEDIKEIKRHTKILVGQIAYPLPLNKDVLKSYDLIISSFPHFVEMFKEMGIKSEYLRWCVEEEVVKKIGSQEKIYDVSYIGGFSPHHSNGNKILEKVAKEVKVDFWGYAENFLLPNSLIRKNYHGNAWGKEMYKIFAQSKIVINRHINISNEYANNMRMFDVTAMNTLLITDDKTNMSEFFEVGKEVVTYKNSDDLIEKIKYYLANDKKREEISSRGKERVLRDHTYKVRMKELDTILKKYL